jgi:hypothetical protein
VLFPRAALPLGSRARTALLVCSSAQGLPAVGVVDLAQGLPAVTVVDLATGGERRAAVHAHQAGL